MDACGGIEAGLVFFICLNLDYYNLMLYTTTKNNPVNPLIQ
jgi:hypothetical protein